MKKLLSVLLSVLLLSCPLCINAFAAESSESKDKLAELIDCHEFTYSIRGSRPPYFTDEEYGAYLKAKKVLDDRSSTEEDYAAAVDNLLYADLYCIYVIPVVAQRTYENAVKEQNYNNWYPEDEWNDYQDKLADLKTALDKITDEDEFSEELTSSFHAVLKIYNKMTNEYTLKGDLNKDGSVNISDVTLLQKYIAGSVNLTGAQKMLTGADWYEDLSIIDATRLQKYISNLITKLPGEDVFIYELDAPYMDEDLLMERTLNFNICPRIWNEAAPVAHHNGDSRLSMLFGYYRFCSEQGYEP